MEILYTILFYIFAAASLGGTLGVIFANRVLYSILFAIVVFLSSAGFYFLLNAPFIATSQIAIYGVGVSLLLVFSIMLTSYKLDKKIYLAIKPSTFLGLCGIALILFASFMFLTLEFNGLLPDVSKYTLNANTIDTTTQIGMGLMNNYVLAFELMSLFLLVALVGIGSVCIYSANEDKSCKK